MRENKNQNASVTEKNQNLSVTGKKITQHTHIRHFDV
jgi:hypothetical protein